MSRRYPVNNRIVVAGHIPFGQPDPNARFGYHAGDDSANGTGTYVYAPADGVVTGYASSQYHGNIVEIRTPDGFYPHVFHLSQRLVSDGQQVKAGDLVGKSGSTGLSTGPHVHFGVSTVSVPTVTKFSQFVDPLQWIKEGEKDMITKEDVGPVRIIMSEVEGWNGGDVHSGSKDSQIMGAWVGRSWQEFIWNGWSQQKTHRQALVDELAHRAGQINTLNTLVTSKDNEIDALKVQLGDENLTIKQAIRVLANLIKDAIAGK